MNKHTKISICVLAVFIVGMTLSVAFAEPVDAKTFKSYGWKFKVSDKKWKTMKKHAKNQYKQNRKASGSKYASGYSTKYAKVTLHKKGHKPFKSILYCRYDIGGSMPYLSSAPWK